MKARGHLGVGLLGIISFFVFDLFIGQNILAIIMTKMKLDIITFFVGIILFVVGLILPDSDSKDAGSKIFYTYFFIFGWINRGLEYPLSKLFDRPIGHRESLHTILGAAINSLFFSILVSIIFYFDGRYNFFIIPFLFICLFLGQMVHFLCDWHWRIK